MRVVLDTNVVMEWLHYDDPRCTGLAAEITAGRWQCCADRDTLAELERVVAYPQFARDLTAQAALLATYQAHLLLIPPAPPPYPLPRCRDRDDQKFLELAARAGAALLISRDRELLRFARRRYAPLPFAIRVPETALSA